MDNVELLNRIRKARKAIAAAEAPGRRAAHIRNGMKAAEYDRHVGRMYGELFELEAERNRRVAERAGV